MPPLNRLEQFASAPTVSPLIAQSGNSPWAQRYSQELKDVVLRYAARLPRNVQRRLGPSELGHVCDRQVVGKMAGVTFGGSAGAVGGMYAWASVVGTAIHAFLEQAFTWDSEQGLNPARWLTERKVTPDSGAAEPHPGTADLYDVTYRAVVDHKGQSEAVRARLRKDGPPLHYFLQLLFYAIGYAQLGFDVRRVALVSWPRTKSTLDDIYVWERQITAADLALALEYLERTKVREQVAGYVAQGAMSLWDVPATPSPEDCEFCPLYNAAALREGTSQGCPGTSMLRKRYS